MFYVFASVCYLFFNLAIVVANAIVIVVLDSLMLSLSVLEQITNCLIEVHYT